MTHQELVELLYKNKQQIHQGYVQGSLEYADKALVDATVFVEVGQNYVLNKNYITFVNSVLDRVDYSIVFGDYQKEHQELIKYKNKYLSGYETFYKNKVLQLVDDIYLKFFYRDKEIAALLKKLESEMELELDLIIEEANNILEKISELIEANTNITNTFIELKSIDETFKEKVTMLDEGFLVLVEKISTYIEWLNGFIIQTKNKRRQNKLFLKVAHDILYEHNDNLEFFLTSNQERLHHTITSSRNRVVTYPKEEDLTQVGAALKEFNFIRVEKPKAKVKLTPPQPQKLDIVNIDTILELLAKQNCEDIFLFLLQEGFEYNKAFLIYLQLLSFEEVVFTNQFNKHNIRIVQWNN